MPYQLIHGFVVRIGERSEYRHVQGGSATHKGATCPTCRRSLVRIWQLDCADPRFVALGSDGRPAFGDLATLPLYYCWTCAAELAYRVGDSDSIQVLRSQGGNPGDDFPYPGYPAEYPEMPLRLYRPDEMPELVRKYILEDIDDPIPEDEQRALSEFFGRPIRSTLGDLWWHQFGGEPWLVQGPEEIRCPNPTCEHHFDDHTMKILAAVCNDPPGGLPMIEPIIADCRVYNRWVQVVFHICESCFTINAANRCD